METSKPGVAGDAGASDGTEDDPAFRGNDGDNVSYSNDADNEDDDNVDNNRDDYACGDDASEIPVVIMEDAVYRMSLSHKTTGRTTGILFSYLYGI